MSKDQGDNRSSKTQQSSSSSSGSNVSSAYRQCSDPKSSSSQYSQEAIRRIARSQAGQSYDGYASKFRNKNENGKSNTR